MTYKQKYQLLLVGILAFTFIAYWLAFGKTWAAYSKTKTLQQQLSNADQAWKQIQTYQQQLKELEAEQNNQNFSQNTLFQKVTNFCHDKKLAIREMPESKVYKQQDIKILHNPIKVEGSYIPIVQLLYELEQKQKLGKVVSVEFNLGKNLQNRKKELVASIYLQNILNDSGKK